MATMARFLCILTNSDNQTAVFLNVETLENETDYLDALAIALEANPECQYGVALPAEALRSFADELDSHVFEPTTNTGHTLHDIAEMFSAWCRAEDCQKPFLGTFSVWLHTIAHRAIVSFL